MAQSAAFDSPLLPPPDPLAAASRATHRGRASARRRAQRKLASCLDRLGAWSPFGQGEGAQAEGAVGSTCGTATAAATAELRGADERDEAGWEEGEGTEEAEEGGAVGQGPSSCEEVWAAQPLPLEQQQQHETTWRSATFVVPPSAPVAAMLSTCADAGRLGMTELAKPEHEARLSFRGRGVRASGWSGGSSDESWAALEQQTARRAARPGSGGGRRAHGRGRGHAEGEGHGQRNAERGAEGGAHRRAQGEGSGKHLVAMSTPGSSAGASAHMASPAQGPLRCAGLPGEAPNAVAPSGTGPGERGEARARASGDCTMGPPQPPGGAPSGRRRGVSGRGEGRRRGEGESGGGGMEEGQERGATVDDGEGRGDGGGRAQGGRAGSGGRVESRAARWSVGGVSDAPAGSGPAAGTAGGEGVLKSPRFMKRRVRWQRAGGDAERAAAKGEQAAGPAGGRSSAGRADVDEGGAEGSARESRGAGAMAMGGNQAVLRKRRRCTIQSVRDSTGGVSGHTSDRVGGPCDTSCASNPLDPSASASASASAAVLSDRGQQSDRERQSDANPPSEFGRSSDAGRQSDSPLPSHAPCHAFAAVAAVAAAGHDERRSGGGGRVCGGLPASPAVAAQRATRASGELYYGTSRPGKAPCHADDASRASRAPRQARVEGGRSSRRSSAATRGWGGYISSSSTGIDLPQGTRGRHMRGASSSTPRSIVEGEALDRDDVWGGEEEDEEESGMVVASAAVLHGGMHAAVTTGAMEPLTWASSAAPALQPCSFLPADLIIPGKIDS
ncbi:hypothetical protein CLOP_g9299 [Closterium sp. NIES-67]|nr:hypothetical protein CLOP_g9299 [Closterium sp. NIES-67]